MTAQQKQRIANYQYTATFALMFCLGLLLETAPMPAHAQQVLYVSDQVYVPLRTGKGTEFRIRMNLKTGQPLTVIELSDDQQWAHVVTEGATEGWTQTQYLSKELPAQLQLASALQKNTKLEEQVAQLRQKNNELESRSKELAQSVSSESQSRDTLSQELDKLRQLSTNAIALDQQNQELSAQNTRLTTEHKKLDAENKQLHNEQRLDFMIYGAALVICGVLLAIIVPALKPKKRQSEWR